MSDSDEPDPPSTIIKLVQPPAAEKASGPTMPRRPPPRPQNLDVVTIDVASGPDAKCRLCDKPVEPGAVQLNYQYSPLIHVKIAFCFRCAVETLLGEAERRYKPLADAEAAADYAEGRRHGFTRDEMRALALRGFGRPVARKMSPEFISAAIDLAGRLRNDWYRGAAGGLPNETLLALKSLLEALGETLETAAR